MLVSGAYFPPRGSTSFVGVNPQVPSVSLIYRKYEVGGLLQHSSAVLVSVSIFSPLVILVVMIALTTTIHTYRCMNYALLLDYKIAFTLTQYRNWYRTSFPLQRLTLTTFTR